MKTTFIIFSKISIFLFSHLDVESFCKYFFSYHVRWGAKYIFLHMGNQLSLYNLLTRPSFPLLYCSVTFIINLAISVSISGLCSITLIVFSFFLESFVKAVLMTMKFAPGARKTFEVVIFRL